MGSRVPQTGAATFARARPPAGTAAGRLYYVAGAADADQDQLIAHARGRLDESHPVMFAHRYSTRTAAGAGECQIVLSEAEFALRRRLGLFAMDWEIAGHCYGIGMELNYWLAMGLSVVMNGSHAHLEHALLAYPEMTLIWITEEARDGAPPPGPAPCTVERPASSPQARARGSGYRMVYLGNGGASPLAGEKLVSVLTGADQ